MDSKTKNTLGKILKEVLLHIFFAMSLIYWYFWFQKLLILSYNNVLIAELFAFFSITSFFYILGYSFYFFEPLKNSKILIVFLKQSF